jgi:hypothetical protein
MRGTVNPRMFLFRSVHDHSASHAGVHGCRRLMAYRDIAAFLYRRGLSWPVQHARNSVTHDTVHTSFTRTSTHVTRAPTHTGVSKCTMMLDTSTQSGVRNAHRCWTGVRNALLMDCTMQQAWCGLYTVDLPWCETDGSRSTCGGDIRTRRCIPPQTTCMSSVCQGAKPALDHAPNTLRALLPK